MSTGRDTEHARHAAAESHHDQHAPAHHGSGPQTRFSSHGPIPPVASHGGAGNRAAASASERAFSGVDLTSVSATVDIPAGRRLAGDWKYSAETTSATTVGAEVGHHGINVWMTPGIYLNVTWPGRDCRIDGMNLQFGPHAPNVLVSDGGGIGLWNVSGMVQHQVSDIVGRALAHTRLHDPHYDPMHDPDLAGTLQQVVRGFASAFGGAGHANNNNRNGVGMRDLTGSGAGASFALHQPLAVAPGIQISGHDVHLSVLGDANLQQLANAHDNAGRARATHIESVSLSSSGLDITVHGEAIARLQRLTFHHGGRVTVESMQPLGRLARAQHTESSLSSLGALILAAAGERRGAEALAENANRPQVVSGVSAAFLAHKVQDALYQVILQHDTAIPGVHLAAALGLR